MGTYTFSREVLEHAAKGIMYRDHTGDSLTAIKELYQDSWETTEAYIRNLLNDFTGDMIIVEIPETINLYDPANYIETGRWVGRVLVTEVAGKRKNVEIERVFDTKEEALKWVTSNIPSPYEECYADHFSAPNAKAGSRIYGYVYAETELK